MSKAIARFACELDWNSIPSPVSRRAKFLMLDAIGVALASAAYDFAGPAVEALVDAGGGGASAVIGGDRRLGLRDAALMNGILIHGIDYDDTHMGSVTHTTASLLPTTLALAEKHGLSGRDMITAFVLGTEVAARIGSVAKGGFHQTGFHPTGVVGAFAAATAAAKLLRLNEAKIADSQGIVLSFASGTFQFLEDGSWTKRLHPGWAASSGITAAYLAGRGFRGVEAPYDGRFGLYATHLKSQPAPDDVAQAFAGLGTGWETLNVALKPFPACHFTHASADAAIQLHNDGVDASRVKRVRVRVPAGVMNIVCEPREVKLRPKTSYDAQFSLQYIVATALLKGRFGLGELAEHALRNPDVLSLAERVICEVNPDADFPRHYSGAVTVEYTDGAVREVNEDINRGSPERPLSESDILRKFEETAQRVAGEDRATLIRDAVLQLDESVCIDNLTALLAQRISGIKQ
ncbi:MAG: MmgE/PrpD family protein [Rhodoferax sp.]|nr:MmgE/PrpD family protein [Rhodoferax sp.]MCP5263397.1 MmgE/PrpD family protein [Rhodoferax sp.]